MGTGAATHTQLSLLLWGFHGCPLWRGLDGLILHLSVPVLSGLPTTVSVMESAEPGTIIMEFNLTCQNESSVPTSAPTLQSTPPTSFFNQPTITHHMNPTVHYSITLSPSAALDALQVNQYTLTLEATCPGETPANGQLFVQVHTVDGPPQCMARFASQGKAHPVLCHAQPLRSVPSPCTPLPSPSALPLPGPALAQPSPSNCGGRGDLVGLSGWEGLWGWGESEVPSGRGGSGPMGPSG
uniref:Uncharacterized protein n=1 Tax=Gopherus agassizii TaxID=38772 RepID=A0A452IFU1_9SAUR